MQAPSIPTCVACGASLSVHERAIGTTCAKEACKSRVLKDRLKKEHERQVAIRGRAVEIRNRIVEEKLVEPSEHLGLGVLPSNDRRLTRLPKRKIRVFLDRLMEKISRAAEIRYGNTEYEKEPDGYDEPSSATESQLAILGNGCATCKGHCCPQGSGHAFIQVDTILKFMEEHPEMRPRHVLDAYLSRIGTRTYEDSCVYHAEQGCLLPREMRSTVCNGFLCKGIAQVLHHIQSKNPARVFVVATEEDEIHRAAVIDEHGFELHNVTPAGETVDSPEV